MQISSTIFDYGFKVAVVYEIDGVSSTTIRESTAEERKQYEQTLVKPLPRAPEDD